MTTYEFLGTEWLTEVERLIRSRIEPEAINYATTSVLTVFENCPGGVEKALLFKTNKGALERIEVVDKPYPQSEFAVRGDYHNFLKVFKGALDPMAAIMGGELHFQGNMLRAMGMISLIEPFYKVLAEIPTNTD
jgi:putative sterol carrier protein